MPRLSTPLLALLAVLVPQALAAAAGNKAPPVVQVQAAQDPRPAAPGREAVLTLSLVPPEGVVLNRYPGVTLVVESSPGLETKEKEVFLGSREPVEEPDRFYLGEDETLRLAVVPDAGGKERRVLHGSLQYFYCVKKSGYCAPARRKVEIPVVVAADGGRR